MSDLVLIGGGALAREIIDWFTPGFAGTDDRFIGYLDDGDGPLATHGFEEPHLGPIAGWTPDPTHRYVVAIGAPAAKAAVVAPLAGKGAVFASLIHPRAWVSRSARIGQGVMIGPFADISANAVVGDFVTVNAFSSVGHDAVTGAFVTLSGYVDLTGGVQAGEGAFFGSGARVLPRVRVGRSCVIGAGAVVVRSAPDGTTLYAAPAKRL